VERALAGVLSASLAVAFTAPVAQANPILSDVLLVRQTPHTHHVQITLGHDGSDDGVAEPAELSRDGLTLDPTWTALDDGYQTNTGSGLRVVDAIQVCDCDLSVGEHTWTVRLPGYDWSMAASLEVVADQDDYQEVDPGPDPDPWDIPDPADMQGLDCAAACDGSDTDDPGDSTGPDDDGLELVHNGCSAAPLGLPAVVVVLLGPLVVRRRRR